MEFTVNDLWAKLGNIPINDREEIELRFLIFPVGTPREEIWYWFEETFDISIHDLMFPSFV